jgi:hypothetical protein
MEKAMKLRSLLADMPAKYAGYHTRLSNLRKWYAKDVSAGRTTDRQLQAMATEHVAKTYDNRDSIPAAFKAFARNPLNLDFLTFRYSNTRALFNSMASLADDMRNPRIPKSYIASRWLQMSTALGYQGAATMGKAKAITAATGALAAFYAKVKGNDLGKLEPADEEIENASRFMFEDYYANESMNHHVDPNGKIVRTVWGGGGSSPFNILVDLPTGMIDAMGAEVSGTSKAKQVANQLIGTTPMAWKTSKNVLDNSVNVFNEWSKWYAARNAGIQYDAKAGAALQEMLADFAKDAGGWYGRTAAEATGYEDKKQAAQLERMTQRGGKPLGDMPTKDFASDKSLREVFASGFIPINTTVFTKENILNNIWNRAYRLHPNKGFLREVIHSQDSEDKPEVRMQALKPLIEWKRAAYVLLKATKSAKGDGEAYNLAREALVKAHYSSKEIDYIMSDGAVTITDGSGPSSPSGPAKGPRGP